MPSLSQSHLGEVFRVGRAAELLLLGVALRGAVDLGFLAAAALGVAVGFVEAAALLTGVDLAEEDAFFTAVVDFRVDWGALAADLPAAGFFALDTGDFFGVDLTAAFALGALVALVLLVLVELGLTGAALRSLTGLSPQISSSR